MQTMKKTSIASRSLSTYTSRAMLLLFTMVPHGHEELKWLGKPHFFNGPATKKGGGVKGLTSKKKTFFQTREKKFPQKKGG